MVGIAKSDFKATDYDYPDEILGRRGQRFELTEFGIEYSVEDMVGGAWLHQILRLLNHVVKEARVRLF